MVLLPIVDRELRAAARATATYRNRAIAAGVVAAAAMVMFFFGSFLQSPSLVGGAMFKTLSWFAFIFCALEGVRKTADCLSEEKREGTLGLLFLTDLKGYDVVFGKLAAMSLNSIYGLLAILPVLALSMLLGGVTPGEYWRMVLALVNLLFFSLCAGIWVSCRSSSEYEAMGRTFLLIVSFALVPFLTNVPALHLLSPTCPFNTAFAADYFRGSRAFWCSLGVTQLLSWALLLWSSLSVVPYWRREQIEGLPKRWWQRLPFGNDRRRAELRTRMLAINPAFWLAGRNPRYHLLLATLILAAAANSTVYIIKVVSKISPFSQLESLLAMIVIINLVLKSLMAAQACHCLSEARRNEALEMLLATPLTPEQIVRGQVLALKRIFLFPVSIILAFEVAGPIGGYIASGMKNSTVEGFILSLLFGTLLIAFFVLDMAALTWAGMWFGLTSKKEGQAVAKTIIFVLLIPICSLILSCFGAPLFLGIPIFWIVWANHKLYAELRRMAGRRQFGSGLQPLVVTARD